MTTTVFESLLNHTYHIWHRTRTDDGMGGWAVALAHISSFPGRIRPATATEREVADTLGASVSHVAYLVANTIVVRSGDVISDTEDLETAELILEVVAVREPSYSDEHWEVDCDTRQREQLPGQAP